MTTLSHLLYRKMQFCTYHKKALYCAESYLIKLTLFYPLRLSHQNFRTRPKRPNIRYFRLSNKDSAQNVSLCAESFTNACSKI